MKAKPVMNSLRIRFAKLEGPDIEGSYQGNVNIEVFSVAPGRAPGGALD